MSSYFASIASSTAISNLGTRLNTLRRTITSGDEADDPENEDCSHISNVLRAYYNEKGRSYPPWLPPDPKTPTAQPRMVVTQASLQQGGYGQQAQPGPRSGGLSDLWGDSSAVSQPPPPSQTSSLRNRPVAIANLRPPLPHSQTPPPPQASRPLPSQRAGSYQTSSSAASQSRLGLDRSGSGSSAQERLRARLHGGGASSPSPPPPQSHSPARQQQPYMSSSRPWEQGDQAGFDGGFANKAHQGYGQSAYSGAGGGGGDGGYNKRPTGLPSGPKPRGPR